MYFNDTGNGRMNADGDIVVADGFDRFLDFNLLLVEVDVILFLGSVTDIFPVMAPKTLPPSPTLTGIVSSTFLSWLARMTASSEAT